MKTTRLIALCLMMGVLSTTSSCSKEDACAKVSCENSGTCSEGKCNCPDGYEGSTCGTLANAKFVGIYSGTLTVNGSAAAQDIVVAPYTTANAILITDTSLAFESKVSATNLTINARGMVAGDTVQLTGNGNLTNGNTLAFTLKAVAGTDSVTLVYQGLKQ